MAKYLKKFETTAEYEAYIGGTPVLPNVSICADNDEGVYYSPKKVQPTPVQPTDEIWYTSTDGNIVDIYNYRLISNTYVDGKGVLKFDGIVTSIDNGQFQNRTNLMGIVIPDSVSTIGAQTFADCSSLLEVTIPEGVTSIDMFVFLNCSSLTNITIPNSVTSISAAAFQYCSSLTNITIPNSVTSIGESAFADCSSLTGVTIPDSVTTIGNYAFAVCSSMTQCHIGDGVTSIRDNAFQKCTSLTVITIPESVTNIGYSAFYNCTSLTSITCLATTPPTLEGWGWFDDTNNCPIYVPSGSVDAYKAAEGWSSYASRITAMP